MSVDILPDDLCDRGCDRPAETVVQGLFGPLRVCARHAAKPEPKPARPAVARVGLVELNDEAREGRYANWLGDRGL